MVQDNSKLDFQELRPNFKPQQAVVEANRCLYCYDAPCRTGCPVNIDIPHFIQSIKTNNVKRAARLINDSNPFGSVCGRVCPVDRLCESKCIMGKMGKPVQISMLQRFAVDNGGFRRQPVEKNGKKIAVVGSGPAGLACASELARNGYNVTVFESKSKAGGMVAFGVPQYRCPHEVTSTEVEKIEAEGVEIKTSTPVNRDVTELFDMGFEAVFIGVGLTKTSRPDIPGMDLKGVYMGLDFLNRIGSGDPPEVGRKVVTIGGGDTAMDCARSAIRLGAEESTLLYRRSFVELPADKVEIEEALEEGVVFRTLAQPVKFIGDENGVLRAVECVVVKLDKADESGRRTPVEIKGSEFRIAANNVIFATGTEPSGLLKKILPNAKYIKGKFLKVDPETCETSIPGVFSGGDVVNMGATVVEAVAEGKKAAAGIMRFLAAKASSEESLNEAEEPVVNQVVEAPVEAPVETPAETPAEAAVEPEAEMPPAEAPDVEEAAEEAPQAPEAEPETPAELPEQAQEEKPEETVES
ncbi:MAG: NAD(P)-dependent oxidoreductase [Firmicutes bacterium]|nr:NAD(P)-dependent oxidoreductase [Bacillota bacterium]